MPSVKTRPKTSKRTSEDPTEREFRRLVLALGDVAAFRLYLATCDDPSKRDALIERATEELGGQHLCVSRLDLEGCEREASLTRLLREHLEAHPAVEGARRAVMVTGLEALLEYGRSEDLRFLATANVQRDLLPKAAPVPVVLWLTPMASSVLPRAATDLWHWRSATFDFTTPATGRADTLRSLAQLAPERELGLSGERRAERVELLRELIDELERGGPPDSRHEVIERLDLQNQLGSILLDLGRAREAIPLFERELDLARAREIREWEGYALGNLGNAWAALGEASKAIEYHEQALKVSREIGDRRGEGNALGNLGVAWMNLGEARKAIESHEQALEVSREIGDRRAEGQDLGNLGLAWADLGEARRAIGFYEQVLEIMREIGDRRGEGNALGNLGNAWLALGEARKAIGFYEQQLAIAREIGDRVGEANARRNISMAHEDLGERGKAVSGTREALKIYESIGAKDRAERANASLKEWGAG